MSIVFTRTIQGINLDYYTNQPNHVILTDNNSILLAKLDKNDAIELINILTNALDINIPQIDYEE